MNKFLKVIIFIIGIIVLIPLSIYFLMGLAYIVGNGHYDLEEPKKMALFGGLGIVLIVIILVMVAKS